MTFPNGNSNGSWLRRIHFWLGVLAGLYFLFLALSGIALNHRSEWRMEEKTVSHRFLPSHYRPLDEGERTRLDIVIADLHSGLLLGKYGPRVNDFIALILVTSTLSGFGLAWRRNRKQKTLSPATLSFNATTDPPRVEGQTNPRQVRYKTSY
jgi:uncharacterized iron-regulated membrane protein